MKKNKVLQAPETMCINTNKVYDWVLEEGTGSTTLLAANLPTALPAGATNVQVNCILTDSTGAPLPINSEIDVTESAPREDRQFLVDGALVTLQRVTFTKTVYIVLEISGVDPATGSQFLITSNPFPPFNFIEEAYLCAPAGTSLIVRVSDFSCNTIINRNAAGDITSFNVNITICQSIQTVAPVTIEITADFCMPREQITEQCTNPTIPPQCPVVFPGV